MSTTLHSIWRSLDAWRLPGRPQSIRRRAVKPALELLEERCVLSPYVRTGGVLTSSANLTHLYQFNSLTDALGGPALVSEGGTLSGGRYSFNANQGLRLSNALASNSNYSIELVMRYNTLGAGTSQFKKFIDFANRTSDRGMYVKRNAANTADNVVFFDGSAGTGVVSAGVDFHFVIARNGTSGVTTIYLNGVLQATYANGSTASNAAIVSAANVLTFFEDDGNPNPGGEAGAGSTDYIAIYDGPLSSADVTALANDYTQPPPSAVTVNEGQTASMNGTFHGSPGTTVTVTSSVGTVTQATGAHGAWSWSFTPDDGPSQSQNVVITATEDNTGASSTTSFQLTVNNVAPNPTFGNDGPVGEGSTAVVSFGGQLDPSAADAASMRFAYDLDNDGTFDIGDGTYAGSVTSSSAVVPASLLADGPGTRTVRGRIMDKDGASADFTTTITINNVAPSVTANQTTVTVDEGQVAVNAGTFSDPGVDTVSLSASFGALFVNADGLWSWSFQSSDGPDESQ